MMCYGKAAVDPLDYVKAKSVYPLDDVTATYANCECVFLYRRASVVCVKISLKGERMEL